MRLPSRIECASNWTDRSSALSRRATKSASTLSSFVLLLPARRRAVRSVENDRLMRVTFFAKNRSLRGTEAAMAPSDRRTLSALTEQVSPDWKSWGSTLLSGSGSDRAMVSTTR